MKLYVILCVTYFYKNSKKCFSLEYHKWFLLENYILYTNCYFEETKSKIFSVLFLNSQKN